MTQGKCLGCRVIYRWQGAPLLRNADCIHCRKALYRHARIVNGAGTCVGCHSADCGFNVTCATPVDSLTAPPAPMKVRPSITRPDKYLFLPQVGMLRFFGVPQETFRG